MEKAKETQDSASIIASIKKAWNWIWHSDSIWSWIVSLIIAFIIVKFVFFPLLSLALATQLPLVVVESGSMSHPAGTFLGNVFSTSGSFNAWWQENSAWYESRSISKSTAASWPLRTGFEKGDIMIIYGRGEARVGDVIVFNANQAHPIIHRIINISMVNGQRVYSTKGDNNADQLYVEKQIPKDAIIGRAVFKIPKLGWIKLVFVNIAQAFSK